MPSDRRLEWAVAGRPIPGAAVSGDRSVVFDAGDRTVIAAIDGLGHGTDAAVAAEVAGRVIEEHAGAPLETVFDLCHEAMAGTRGAAITLAVVSDGGQMDWLAVGNVEAVIIRGGQVGTGTVESVYHLPGVVGDRLPTLRTPTTRLERGDVLVLNTDGITGEYLADRGAIGPVDRAAARILAAHARSVDDALVIVSRMR